eukprot:Hpha_TRINITY_DN16969_c2_g3::TRINITY_DN16969_c2_g3_i4::g.52054::m.52054
MDENTLTRNVPHYEIRGAIRVPMGFQHSGRRWRLVAFVESLPKGGTAVVAWGGQKGRMLRRVVADEGAAVEVHLTPDGGLYSHAPLLVYSASPESFIINDDDTDYCCAESLLINDDDPD